MTVVPASQGYITHFRIIGTENFEASSSGGINIYRIGQNLAITFTTAQYPADLMIHDKDTDEIYLLALVPKPIPPRSYELILSPDRASSVKEQKHAKPGYSTKKETKEETKVVKIKVQEPVFTLARPEGFEEDYESTLLDVISQIALGKKLQGFSEETPWLELEYRYEFRPLKGLVLHSVKRYRNADLEAVVFLARNEGKHTLKLREPYLWREGTLAVSFLRNFFNHEDQQEIVLHPGESVPVIVLQKRERVD